MDDRTNLIHIVTNSIIRYNDLYCTARFIWNQKADQDNHYVPGQAIPDFNIEDAAPTAPNLCDTFINMTAREQQLFEGYIKMLAAIGVSCKINYRSLQDSANNMIQSIEFCTKYMDLYRLAKRLQTRYRDAADQIMLDNQTHIVRMIFSLDSNQGHLPELPEDYGFSESTAEILCPIVET